MTIGLVANDEFGYIPWRGLTRVGMDGPVA